MMRKNFSRMGVGLIASLLLSLETVVAYSQSNVEQSCKIKLVADIYKNMTLNQVVEEVKTWDGAKNYILTHLEYKDDEDIGKMFSGGVFPDYVSFNIIHKIGFEDCDGGAVAGAALLSDNDNYECLHMLLNSKGIFRANHVVSLIYDKEKNKFGALGINDVDCVPVEFDTPDDVYNVINKAFSSMFKSYELNTYDKSTLLNGKNLVDRIIDDNKKYYDVQTCFILDVGGSDDKRYVFFDDVPVKHSTFQDWLDAAEDKQRCTKKEARSQFLYSNSSKLDNYGLLRAPLCKESFESPCVVIVNSEIVDYKSLTNQLKY